MDAEISRKKLYAKIYNDGSESIKYDYSEAKKNIEIVRILKIICIFSTRKLEKNWINKQK